MNRKQTRLFNNIKLLNRNPPGFFSGDVDSVVRENFAGGARLKSIRVHYAQAAAKPTAATSCCDIHSYSVGANRYVGPLLRSNHNNNARGVDLIV